MEHIVWMIYRHAPATIAFEDSDGVSAIEYALEAEVNMDFFKALQHLLIHFNQNNARKIALRKRQETEVCRGNQDKAARRPRAAHAA